MSEKSPIKIEVKKSPEAHRQSKELHKSAERHRDNAAELAKDTHHEREKARHEVHEHAVSASEQIQPQSEQRSQQTAHTTKKDKELAFDTIMHHTRSQMSKTERTFSKLIHQPAVEKTSEALGKTVARPSGIAGATVAAGIGLLSVYSVAKFAGFQLAGSEMPLLLAGGFLAGLFVEWAYKSMRAIIGKRSPTQS